MAMLRLLVLLTAGAAWLSGALPSGAWEGVLTTPKGKSSFYFEFQETDGKLSGLFGLRRDFLSPLASASRQGNDLEFEFKMSDGPAAKFQGVLEWDSAVGTLTLTPPGVTGKFEMKRLGPASRLPDSFGPAGNAAELRALSDEFDNPASLDQWKRFSSEESWPDRIETVDVSRSSPGNLTIVPDSGAWWAGYHGVFLFKPVKGDFVLTTRLKVTGKSGGEPASIWTISGLLVRVPGNLRVAAEQRKENWVYLMTGRGPRIDRVIDAKSTLDNLNAWDITPASAGWYDLRIARLGPLLILLARPDGGEWTVRKRIFRPDFPETLQAGINVTSDFKLSASMPPARYNAGLFPGEGNRDSLTLFDYVRFQPVPNSPELRGRIAGKELQAIPDAELLALFRSSP